jgi:hypothetical protein
VVRRKAVEDTRVKRRTCEPMQIRPLACTTFATPFGGDVFDLSVPASPVELSHIWLWRAHPQVWKKSLVKSFFYYKKSKRMFFSSKWLPSFRIINSILRHSKFNLASTAKAP